MSDFLRRLEDELVRSGYSRAPRSRLRRSGLKPVFVAARLALLLGGVLGASALLDRDPVRPAREEPTVPTSTRVVVTPSRGGPKSSAVSSGGCTTIV